MMSIFTIIFAWMGFLSPSVRGYLLIAGLEIETILHEAQQQFAEHIITPASHLTLRKEATAATCRGNEGTVAVKAQEHVARSGGSARVVGAAAQSANAIYRTSEVASARARGAASVRHAQERAPQTRRLVRRSWSPRVLIYACRCVFRVITGGWRGVWWR